MQDRHPNRVSLFLLPIAVAFLFSTSVFAQPEINYEKKEKALFSAVEKLDIKKITKLLSATQKPCMTAIDPLGRTVLDAAFTYILKPKKKLKNSLLSCFGQFQTSQKEINFEEAWQKIRLVLDLLIDAGADVNQNNWVQWRPEEYPIKQPYQGYPILGSLIEWTRGQWEGESPLLLQIKPNNLFQIGAYFLEKGANPHFFFSENQAYGGINFRYDNYFYIHFRNYFGCYFLEFAVSEDFGNELINKISLLIKAEADIVSYQSLIV